MAKTKYHLHLKGFVGGWNFDREYVDYILNKFNGQEVNVLIDSLGGRADTALSIYASFKRHGKVNVHFVGMNASASTIASMGAARITMDRSAMYLVHKCRTTVFKWENMNSDELKRMIEEFKLETENMEKLDENIAAIYAAKCKKPVKDLKELMSKGGWLTSKEALDWGFVDEVTDFEDDQAPVLDEVTMTAMAHAGIPMPKGMEDKKRNILQSIAKFFGFKAEDDDNASEASMDESGSIESEMSNTMRVNNEQDSHQSQNDMKKILTFICAILACKDLTLSEDKKITFDEAQVDSIESAIAADKKTINDLNSQVSALQEENKTLKAQVEALNKKPAEDTTTVVGSKVVKESNIFEEYANKVSAAQELFNAIS